MQRISIEQAVKLRDLICAKPMSYEAMGEVMGMSRHRVARWVSNNRENIYIADFGPDVNGRLFIAQFAWGAEPDAKRPGRVLTPAEQMRKMRALRKLALT